MLKVVFSTDMFTAFLLKAEQHVLDCMSDALATLVKECDEKARNRGFDESFGNITGNLRSSIGGAVYRNGEIYFISSFEQILDGSKGSAEGRNMAHRLAGQYTDSVIMVMFAAMDYAEKVEALASKDVLESTRIYAESVVQQRLEAARDKAIKDINSWKL